MSIGYNPSRVHCDHPGCVGRMVEPRHQALMHVSHIVHEAQAAGWLVVHGPADRPFWTSQRHYCPEHRPQHVAEASAAAKPSTPTLWKEQAQ